MSSLISFFAKVEGSFKGFVNPEELFRSIITALGSGTVIGLLILVLQALLTNVSAILPDPAIASLVSMVLTLVLDLLRRQAQGTTPTPVTPVAPVAPVAPASIPPVPLS